MQRPGYLPILGAMTLAGAFLSAAAQVAPPARDAQRLIRLLDTVQNEHVTAAGRYVSLGEALTHPALAETLRELEPFTDGPQSRRFGNQRVTLVVSDDGRTYQLSVVPFDACERAWFSDQQGVIDTGRALGCAGG